MDDNFAIFMVMVVAIAAAVVLTVLTTWIRGTQRDAHATAALANPGSETAALLASENDELKDQVRQLEQRLRALERTAAEPAAHEIEMLR